MSAKVCKRTLCVKNLPQPSDNLVSSLFGPLGGNLLKVMTSGDNNRKDILVEFDSEELASKAREAMHGKVVDGTNLFVDYAFLGQPSFTSPSKEKAQKQKVSVLDRIIKAGNSKSSKVEDKPTILGGLASGKDSAGPDNLDINNTSQQKPLNEVKLEKGQMVSQPNILKKGKLGGNFQQNNGNLDGKNNNVQNKKHYNTQGKGRGNHKMQKKLEIIKPKQALARAQEQSEAIVTPKEVTTIMKDNSELTGNPQLVKSVFEIVQKKFETNNMEISTRTGSNSRPLDSTVKNKTISRSRSRSQGRSYPQVNRSNSRNKLDPYYYPRRSGSPSSHQRHSAARPKSRSRSRSYDKYGSGPRNYSYSSHRGDRADPYYDERYKNSYYRRSRSRSISKRGEYSPYRERSLRRDDPHKYDYRDRSSRDRSRSRSRPRRSSRSRSWSKSRSRHGYDDYRRRSSISRSRSRSGYRGDASYKRDEQRPAYTEKYVTKGGLVIEKKNTPGKKYDSNYGDDRYRQKGYSRSRSRDRVYSRSRSRDRRPSPGQRPADYYRYRDRSFGRHPEGGDRDRNRKALDTRKGSNSQHQQQRNLRNRPDNTNRQNERNKESINKMPREKTELASVVNGSKSKDLEPPVASVGVNQQYGNYNNNMNISSLQFYPNHHMLNFANPSGGPHIPVHQSTSSLPSYLYSSPMMDANCIPLINSGNLLLSATGVSLPPEATAVQKGYNTEPQRGEMEGEKVEVSNIENSTTENSNIDMKEKMEVEATKKEGSPDLPEQTPLEVDEGRAETGLPITNDFIKKNKMQAFINYLVTTGDIQGLKEKLKSIEKPKDSK